MEQTKLYKDSGIELTKFTAHHYDLLMNSLSFGKYGKFIDKAIRDLKIKPDSSILDLGCGTGRNASLILQYLDNRGKIMGLDLSSIMQGHFKKRFANEKRVHFQKQRIDIPFDLNEKFDVVFISFVIHGFPHEVRNTIIDNSINHLKPDGIFAILDFAEFDIKKIPALHRWVFKTIECPYAYDFVERDWETLLKLKGLEKVSEDFYFFTYVRLLKTRLV